MMANTGERIKSARKACGMTQAELAEKIGVKFSAIHKYESGLVVNLKRDTIAALAKALDVSPAWLMCMDDAPAAPRTNTLRIAGRDGTLIEKKLSDEQVAALKGIIDQFPEADDDL